MQESWRTANGNLEALFSSVNVANSARQGYATQADFRKLPSIAPKPVKATAPSSSPPLANYPDSTTAVIFR